MGNSADQEAVREVKTWLALVAVALLAVCVSETIGKAGPSPAATRRVRGFLFHFGQLSAAPSHASTSRRICCRVPSIHRGER
jgi:hypothetical protein